MKLLNCIDMPNDLPKKESSPSCFDKSPTVVKRKSDEITSNQEPPSKRRLICMPPHVRRFPCKARTMPEDHNVNTAFLEVGPNTPHGMILSCSSLSCNRSGRKFRFCSVCNMPVAKRNFFRRHGHGLFKSSKEIRDKVDKVFGYGSPTDVSPDRLQPMTASEQGPDFPSVGYCQTVSAPSIEDAPSPTCLQTSWDSNTAAVLESNGSPYLVSPDIRGLAGVSEETDALEPISIESIKSNTIAPEERTLQAPLLCDNDLVVDGNQPKRSSLTHEDLDRVLDSVNFFDKIFDEVPALSNAPFLESKESPHLVSPDIRGLAGVSEETDALEPISIESIQSSTIAPEERTLQASLLSGNDLAVDGNQPKRSSLTHEDLDRALDSVNFFDKIFMLPQSESLASIS